MGHLREKAITAPDFNSIDAGNALLNNQIVKRSSTFDDGVLVVGAGPVGLSIALALKERNIPVSLIERDDRPGTHSYALALHPWTVEQLGRWGILEPLKADGLEISHLAFFDDTSCQYELDLTKIGSSSAGLLVVGQDHLEEALMKPLNDAAVPVHWSHRLASIKSGEAGVEVELEHLSEGMSGYAMARLEWQVEKELSSTVPYVVGADGHLSIVRRRLGIDFPKMGPTQSFAVFEFKSNFAHDNRARIVFGEKGTSILWPLPGGYCRWGFEIDESDADTYSRDKDRLFVQVGSHGFQALEDSMLKQLLSERAHWFDGSIDQFRWRMMVRFEKRLTESFGSDRVWLAGDAGHLAAPIGMQSMNIGIREGCELATVLADTMEGRGGPDLLAAYGQGRIEEWRALMGLDTSFKAGAETPDFIKAHLDKLHGCLPASLGTLPAFCEALKVELA